MNSISYVLVCTGIWCAYIESMTMKYYDDIGYRKGSQGNLACSDKAAALLSVLKTQCAWCNRMTKDEVAYGIPFAEKDLTASHGICKDCYKDMMKSDEGGESDNA